MSGSGPRVLLVSKACYVAAYRQKLVELARLGANLTLVVPPYWQFREQRAPFEPGPDEGYRIEIVQPVLNGKHHLHFYPALPRLIARYAPDLIHLDEEPYDAVTYFGLRAAKRVGRPLVFFTWQNIDRRFPPPFRWFERYALRRAAGAQAGNTEAAAILRRKGFRGPVAGIPQFGVDPDVFTPTAREQPALRPGALRIGYLGRLVPEKGLWVLLDAVAGLPGDWQLDLVGSGPLAADLEAAARERGLSDQVRLLPPVGSREVAKLLAGWNVLALPSLTTPSWKEQFGRVLIEAMACGAVPVGSDSGEIPNVIGPAGLVVPEGDAPALRTALDTLRDAEQRAGLAVAGRQRVLNEFTQRRVAEQTLAFYEDVLATRRG